MPSQKRYRQYQENNNSARFRDLPPRFKRQKSSTPAEENSCSEAASLEIQNNIVNIHCQDKETDLRESVKSQSVMAPSYLNVLQRQGNLQPAGTRTQIPQTSQAAASTSQWPQKMNNSLILSPLDCRQLDRAANVQPPKMPPGTHSGYKILSPPLSQWPCKDVSSISAPNNNVANSHPWIESSINQRTHQQPHNVSGYFNNENWVPSDKLKYNSSPPAFFCSSNPLQQHNISTSSQSQSQPTLSSKPNGKSRINKEIQTTGKRVIDYSDPDIRTIEMLRELERVADEKESEGNNFGSDRKSLVSHHLRMLMCAVDRYTEGIDDDISMTTRSDEVMTNDSYAPTPRDSPVSHGLLSVTPSHSPVGPRHSPVAPRNSPVAPRNSPVPIESWAHKQGIEGTQKPIPNLGATQWNACSKESVWNGSPAEATPVQLTTSSHSLDQLFHSQQVTPEWQHQKNLKSPETAAWDLWSSPSFDFSGVLVNQRADDLTRDPFGRFADKSERESKPLYQR